MKVPDRSVFETADAETRVVSPAGLQSKIDDLLASFSRGKLSSLSALVVINFDKACKEVLQSTAYVYAADFMARLADSGAVNWAKQLRKIF